ncbi:dimethylamine monooxygenase subunit DmmA family protein [Mycobacterium sp. DL592]|uniref:dimethylamine monooxygenase subunit DmmA family protein n=1 Tax=Mycobacterium sp. DL592 TaxID=2675524 RepID=UPI001421CCAF|nr:dimethylamine monooxygenase subunit DmmA family protein [Mycobacterium sp. DL592]
MSPNLALTSVPPWAVEEVRPPADLSGRSWTVLAIGTDAEPVAQQWAAEVGSHHAGAALRIHHVSDAEAACSVLAADVADAVVGWRLLLAGPAHACLRVRSRAIDLGVGDDEMTVATTEVNTRTVYCAHCRHVSTAEIELTGELPCTGCGRRLFVHYHVSRRVGSHLGFATHADRADAP